MTLQSGLALFRHQRRLAARLAARVGRTEAEDLASEAVTRGLARPAPDGRQEPWLEIIFRNLVVDAGRRQSRHGSSIAGPTGTPAAAAALAEASDPGASPEELLLSRERARAVGAAMPEMPKELREAVIARFYEDRDYEEMAATNGISATTARTRVWRGLARLRRSLAAMRVMFPVLAPGGLAGGLPSLAAALVPAMTVAVLALAPGAGREAPGAAVGTAEGEVARAPRGSRSSAERAGRLPRPLLADASEKRTPSPSSRSAPAVAQVARHAASASSGDEDHAPPVAVKRFDFEADDVSGELKRPGFIVVTGRPREVKAASLIEIPTSFEPSMTKMIEDM